MVKKVVLTDDDRDDASLFREALQEVDGNIILEYFESGSQLIDHISLDRKQLPDVIFLDINMPVVSGWICLEKFRESGLLEKVPVYIYTTSSHKKEKERALEMGASGFITKPTDFKELIGILRQLLIN